MHTTAAGERRKALKSRARKLEKEARAVMVVEGLEHEARVRQEEAERLRSEAEGLKPVARLEDLHLWQMEKLKDTKKGPKTYSYWMATWREEGGEVRNVYLGSCKKVPEEEALQKARRLKKDSLGLIVGEGESEEEKKEVVPL
ncbi:MAG: hypothetical protein QUS09_02760 [Methanotrichaceae archaeon]|nr:hypothetical protein [Methanotrichaceae archaeon]